MALTHIPLDQITDAHLFALINAGAAKSLHIEYKRELSDGNGDARREFLADISGRLCQFSRRRPGYRHGRVRKVCRPSSARLPETLTPRRCALEQMARDGLAPRLANLRIVAVPLSQGGCVIVLRIPKSYNPRHSLISNSGRFWARSSAGKFEPNVEELRQIFVELPLIGDRVRSFRAERTAKIAAGEAPVGLLGGGNLILHVVPFSAFDSALVLP